MPPLPRGIGCAGGQHQVNRCLEPLLITCLCARVHLGVGDIAAGAGREVDGVCSFFFFFNAWEETGEAWVRGEER